MNLLPSTIIEAPVNISSQKPKDVPPAANLKHEPNHQSVNSSKREEEHFQDTQDIALEAETEEVLNHCKSKLLATRAAQKDLQKQLEEIRRLEATLLNKIQNHNDTETALDDFTDELQTQLLVRKASATSFIGDSTFNNKLDNNAEHCASLNPRRVLTNGSKRDREGNDGDHPPQLLSSFEPPVATPPSKNNCQKLLQSLNDLSWCQSMKTARHQMRLLQLDVAVEDRQRFGANSNGSVALTSPMAWCNIPTENSVTPLLVGGTSAMLITNILAATRVQHRIRIFESELSKTQQSLVALEETVVDGLRGDNGDASQPRSPLSDESVTFASILGTGPPRPNGTVPSSPDEDDDNYDNENVTHENGYEDDQKLLNGVGSILDAMSREYFTISRTAAAEAFLKANCPMLELHMPKHVIEEDLTENIERIALSEALVRPLMAKPTTPQCLFCFKVNYCTNTSCPYLHPCQGSFVAQATETILYNVERRYEKQQVALAHEMEALETLTHNKRKGKKGSSPQHRLQVSSDETKSAAPIMFPPLLGALKRLSGLIGKQHSALSIAAFEMECQLERLVDKVKASILPQRQLASDDSLPNEDVVSPEDVEFLREVEGAATQWLQWLSAFKSAVATDAYIWQAAVVCTIIARGYHLDQNDVGSTNAQNISHLNTLHSKGTKTESRTITPHTVNSVTWAFESSLQMLPFTVPTSTFSFHASFSEMWTQLLTNNDTAITRSDVVKICIEEIAEVAIELLDASTALVALKKNVQIGNEASICLSNSVALLHQREEVAWRALILITQTFPAHELASLTAMLQQQQDDPADLRNATQEKVRVLLENETALFRTAVNRCPYSLSLHLERCIWMWKFAKTTFKRSVVGNEGDLGQVVEVSHVSQCDEVVEETHTHLGAVTAILISQSHRLTTENNLLQMHGKITQDLQLLARLGTHIALRHVVYCASKCLSGSLSVGEFIQLMTDRFLSVYPMDVTKIPSASETTEGEQVAPAVPSDSIFAAPPPPPPVPISRLSYLGPWGLYNISTLILHFIVLLGSYHTIRDSLQTQKSDEELDKKRHPLLSNIVSFLKGLGASRESVDSRTDGEVASFFGSLVESRLVAAADGPIEWLDHFDVHSVINCTIDSLLSMESPSLYYHPRGAEKFTSCVKHAVATLRSRLRPTLKHVTNHSSTSHPLSRHNHSTKQGTDKSEHCKTAEIALVLLDLLLDATELGIQVRESEVHALTSKGYGSNAIRSFLDNLPTLRNTTPYARASSFVWRSILGLCDTLEALYETDLPSIDGLSAVQLSELYHMDLNLSTCSRRSVTLAQSMLRTLIDNSARRLSSPSELCTYAIIDLLHRFVTAHSCNSPKAISADLTLKLKSVLEPKVLEIDIHTIHHMLFCELLTAVSEENTTPNNNRKLASFCSTLKRQLGDYEAYCEEATPYFLSGGFDLASEVLGIGHSHHKESWRTLVLESVGLTPIAGVFGLDHNRLVTIMKAL